VPLGEGGVTVRHFFELCSEIIGQDLAYEKEEPDYYDIIVQETLEKAESYGKTYDAILVDEGQDLSDDMYRVLVALLNKKTSNLTISLDENQNIYKRRTSWEDLGIQARGRIHSISCVYRNTREITSFANRFIKSVEPDKDKSDKGKQKELFPDFFDFSGPKPELCQFNSFDEIVEYAVTKTKEIVETDQCPYSEIAVLYAMKNPGKSLKTLLPEMIESTMESKGILSRWVSENYRSKKTHDITTNSVTISTIHSVKGLDYSTVFLLGVDFLEPHNWSLEQIERLIYVAITRARYQLYIPYINKTPFIEKLLASV
jgi:superfamily I DNA/RNA helicase